MRFSVSRARRAAHTFASAAVSWPVRVREPDRVGLGTLKSEDPEPNRIAVAGGAVAGGFVGAGLGFVAVLVTFGMLGGDGQSGVAAILFGIPIGAWVGAEMGSRRARRDRQ
jgi:hypothetical protein